jgi:hypothetical protein
MELPSLAVMHWGNQEFPLRHKASLDISIFWGRINGPSTPVDKLFHYEAHSIVTMRGIVHKWTRLPAQETKDRDDSSFSCSLSVGRFTTSHYDDIYCFQTIHKAQPLSSEHTNTFKIVHILFPFRRFFPYSSSSLNKPKCVIQHITVTVCPFYLI